MEEIEVKFLDINVDEIQDKLLSIGAEKAGETISEIVCFDYPDYSLKSINAWVRLRCEFGKTTLAYKERIGVSTQDSSVRDGGMKEIEITVSDFEQTRNFLKNIGMIEKFEEERKRIRWIKDDVEFDIDIWPLTPAYLEIESDSIDKVKNASQQLGLNYEEHIVCSAHNVFLRYGFDEHDYSIFTFDKQIKK